MFKHVPSYAGDPIFEVGEAFHRDPREKKVNLPVGLYCDDDEKVPMPTSVTEAERRLAEIRRPRTYLPIEGLAAYPDSAVWISDPA